MLDLVLNTLDVSTGLDIGVVRCGLRGRIAMVVGGREIACDIPCDFLRPGQDFGSGAWAVDVFVRCIRVHGVLIDREAKVF